MTTICNIADLHDGSPVGLTANPKNQIQYEVLNRYIDSLSCLFPTRPDYTHVLGDATEGVDPKLDIDTPKVMDQLADAANCIVMTGATKEYIITRGTRVHTGVVQQDMDEALASMIKIKHREVYDEDIKVSVFNKTKVLFNDWFLFEARHYIGASIIPHGRATASLRSQMWNVMNAALESYHKEQPARWPHLLNFAHVHYYSYAENAWGSVLINPCWKALGDHYGDTKCDGHVDVGTIRIDIGDTEGDWWSIQKKLYPAAIVSRTVSRS